MDTLGLSTDLKNEHTLFISVSSAEYASVRGRAKKIAPSAYSGISEKILGGGVFWGRGYVSDNQSYFAQCIVHYLDDLILESDDSFSLIVCLENDGARLFLEKFAWDWKANQDKNSAGKTPNNFKAWERALLLSQLGKLSFRKPNSPEDISTLSKTRISARQRAKEMPAVSFETSEGLVERGN